MKRRALLSCGVAAAALLTASPAAAHKLKIFALWEGEAVSGYAYFVGGGRPQGAPVTVSGPDGAALLSGLTDAEGRFRLTPPETARAQALRLVVEGADGHRAEVTLSAEAAPAPSPSAPTPAVAAGAASPSCDAGPGLAALVEAATARQIRPLREQLDAFESRATLQDLLGGLGVIAGVAGVGYGAAMRRRAGRTP